MTLNELIKIVESIAKKKDFKLNYRLIRDGRFGKFLNCDNPHELHAFLIDVLESEPAEFEDNK